MNKPNWLLLLIILIALIFTSRDISLTLKVDSDLANFRKNDFGITPTGERVNIFTLTNKNGLRADIINYGAILVSLFVPDLKGGFNDIVLGYDTLKEYIEDTNYFGAIIGRYAQNISNAEITIDSKKYKLSSNNAVHTIHGGTKGFNKQIWEYEKIISIDGVGLKLSYTSKDGEEGFPGNLITTVIYTLTNSNELKIQYLAKTDYPTVINLTHHSYFNLSGQGNGLIYDHYLKIDADKITEEGEGMIPTGKLLNVIDTPLDFSKFKRIGKDLKSNHYQLKFGNGYDHNYITNNYDGRLRKVAQLYEEKSGRFIEMSTTEPGLQLYVGNFLNGEIGKNNKIYNRYSAVCLEAQHFPDSPNNSNFPSTVLRPNEEYEQTTIYKFSTKEKIEIEQ